MKWSFPNFAWFILLVTITASASWATLNPAHGQVAPSEAYSCGPVGRASVEFPENTKQWSVTADNSSGTPLLSPGVKIIFRRAKTGEKSTVFKDFKWGIFMV